MHGIHIINDNTKPNTVLVKKNVHGSVSYFTGIRSLHQTTKGNAAEGNRTATTFIFDIQSEVFANV